MNIYIVVIDVVNDVMYSRKSVNTCVVITPLLHDITHWKTVMSYDKECLYIFNNVRKNSSVILTKFILPPL